MAKIPLWLEMKGRRVLVVGGGRVGARRALYFRSAGAEVRVVGLDFSRELIDAARRDDRLKLVSLNVLEDARGLEELVEWADIVVVATSSPAANEKVWAIASARRKWVNDATDASRTEIVVPYRAAVLDDAVEIAVTSLGKSGVVARNIRDIAVECIEENSMIKLLYQVMWRVKPVLKTLIKDGRLRFPAYLSIEEAVKEVLRKGQGLNDALKAAAEKIVEHASRHGIVVNRDEVLDALMSVKEPVKPLGNPREQEARRGEGGQPPP
ncbi:MAG: bifunctional precorrin-2 dehydrogenase/sirohydrochlorin ferrochelatase [Hyperthermus sp.]|nr:MAG: bifunctional precorrin-2 dehydrogenase/sirohydrochlorin ferrochelatase [Hyperthermus sp.]